MSAAVHEDEQVAADHLATRPGDPTPRRAPRIVDWWMLSAAVLAALAATVPLVWDRLYFYADDTINGALGQWFHTGQTLREGTVPVLDPSIWSSGNFLAEGQWGTFNPFVLGLSYLVSGVENAALFITIFKIGVIAFGAAGVYALAKTFGARPELALFAGVAAPFTGFTIYFDAPSWVTGLMAWSLIPWAWALLHRVVFHGKNPAALLVAVYLLVSIGYVHGTIALIFVMLAVGIQTLVMRSFASSARVIATAVFAGLVAITVHLPSLLTAPVTNRGGNGVYMDQYMGLDLSGIAMSVTPTALPQVTSWWWPGFASSVPIAYLTWALPLVLLVDWRRFRKLEGIALQLAVAGGLFFLFQLLPTVVGPLRYPSRMLPYVALVLLVAMAVGLSRCLVKPVRPWHLWAGFGITAFSAFLAWAQQTHLWRSHAVSALLTAAALTAVWLLLSGRVRVPERLRAQIVAAVLVAATVVMLAFQHWTFPSPPWESQEQPTKISALQKPLSEAVNDTIVVGDALEVWPGPQMWDETLLANLWYVNEHTVINRYQLLGFRSYNQTMCLEYLGGTCPELLENLFEPRDATGMLLVDQISVDTIQIIKEDVPRKLWAKVPDGWHVAADEEYTRTWVRDEPVGTAGSVLMTSDGLQVEVVERSDTAVTFKVLETAPDGDNRVVFSRLAWPGYSTSVGEIGPEVDDFLLSVDLPADAVGSEVTVQFRPPGFALEMACLALALLGGAGAAVGHGVVRRRRRSRSVETAA